MIYDMEMALNKDGVLGPDKEIFRSQTCNYFLIINLNCVLGAQPMGPFF